MDWLFINVEVVQSTKNRKLQQIKETVDRINEHLEYQKIIEIRTGFDHLIAALNSSVEKVKDNELNSARNIFSKLVHLKPDETSSGIANNDLIMLSYVGNYHYFRLLEDTANCAKCVYESTLRFPQIVYYFPPEFYDEKYSEIFPRVYSELKYYHKNLRGARWKNVWEQGWRWSIKGVVLGGIAALGLIGTKLSFGLAAPLAVHSAKEAEKGLNNSLGEPDLENTELIKSSIKRLKKELEEISQKLVDECTKKLELIQKHSLEELFDLQENI